VNSIVRVITVVFVVALGLLYIYYFYPEVFFGLYDSYGVLFFVMFGTLVGLSFFLPKWASTPLWGFKKTSSGHKDTSVEQHPYVVLALTFVIVGSGTWLVLFRAEDSTKDILYIIGVTIYLLIGVLFAIYRQRKKNNSD
jgi:hypothetical protein